MDWHSRYLQQARWTEQLRHYLFNKVRLGSANRVLEVGCGTGAVLADISLGGSLHGLDINLGNLKQAHKNVPGVTLTSGDGERMPFASSMFDIAFCHFLLLWVHDPTRVVMEMCRVVRPGGAILALAEPDYGGRIDHPPVLAEAGRWQVEALKRQGANPEMGRNLATVFSRAGLKLVRTGILGGEWENQKFEQGQKLEWQVLAEDLENEIPLDRLKMLKELEQNSREKGERVLFVPTFFAWGFV